MGGLISKGKRNGKGNLRVPPSNGAVFCSPSKLHYQKKQNPQFLVTLQ